MDAALLETVERETGPDPRWTVLWLHGLGADGHDFAPIVPELVRRDWPALRFVFPHAPERAVTINGGMRMRAWYGIAESVAQVQALIDREADRGIPAARLLLAGFSQGGAVALAAGLQRTQPLAGLVALSTYLPMHDRAASLLSPQALAQPVFMAHGLQDPVVPFAAGQYSAGALQALGFAVDWHRYAMPHSVCAEEVRDLGDWLAQRFAAG